MKTDDLILVLAADRIPPRPILPGAFFAFGLPILALGAVFLVFAGIRPDLVHAMTDPVTVWKWILPVLIASAGTVMALRLTRPDELSGVWRFLLWAVAGIGAVLFAGQMAQVAPADWMRVLQGGSLWFCLSMIFIMGFPGLLATLVVLRRGASTRARLTGWATGLACGGIATIIYATHCNEDAPMFFVTWYGGAIVLLGLAGTALGPRMLRW